VRRHCILVFSIDVAALASNRVRGAKGQLGVYSHNKEICRSAHSRLLLFATNVVTVSRVLSELDRRAFIDPVRQTKIEMLRHYREFLIRILRSDETIIMESLYS
jgi:hypothetical protein